MAYKNLNKNALSSFKRTAVRATMNKANSSDVVFYDPSVKKAVLKNKQKGIVYRERTRKF